MAATVKLPGKLINNESPARRSGSGRKEKSGRQPHEKRLFNLLIWGKIGGKLQKYPENERKMSKNL